MLRAPLGNDDTLACDCTREVRNPAVVVVMEMREDDRVEMEHAGATERLVERPRRPCIDEHGMRAFLDEDRIPLPDIEHHHARRRKEPMIREPSAERYAGYRGRSDDHPARDLRREPHDSKAGEERGQAGGMAVAGNGDRGEPER